LNKLQAYTGVTKTGTSKIALVLGSTSTEENGIYEILKLLTFSFGSGFETCLPKKLELCSDEQCQNKLTTTITDDVYLKTPSVNAKNYMSSSKLIIKHTTPMVQSIYLQATSHNVSTIINGLAVVCGQETITFDESSASLLNVFLAKKSDTALEISLDKVWTSTHPNQEVEAAKLCPITSFVVCPTESCASKLDTLGELTITNSVLSVDISKSLSQTTYYVSPVTKGGIQSPKAIQI